MRGKWNRITLHLNAKPKKPNVKVFFNEKLIANFEHELPYDPKYYYWQYGVYRSFVSRHGPPMPAIGFVMPQVVGIHVAIHHGPWNHGF